MVIPPGLKMEILSVKSTIVDSSPILVFPPLRINLILFPNSSFTSAVVTGLNFEEIFALGAANGKFNLDNKFWVILFFGNRTAIVFLFALTYFDNLEFFFY